MVVNPTPRKSATDLLREWARNSAKSENIQSYRAAIELAKLHWEAVQENRRSLATKTNTAMAVVAGLAGLGAFKFESFNLLLRWTSTGTVACIRTFLALSIGCAAVGFWYLLFNPGKIRSMVDGGPISWPSELLAWSKSDRHEDWPASMAELDSLERLHSKLLKANHLAEKALRRQARAVDLGLSWLGYAAISAVTAALIYLLFKTNDSPSLRPMTWAVVFGFIVFTAHEAVWKSHSPHPESEESRANS